ncbi:lytic transglycosylase domain-containing protein [Inquilinus sp. NPDC058860]|uniref:lytic transglycosylase domain-containing protein n=1 Tax=Inquilinus sp. NPDC058860 TaxID=3346652 RepID=UPI0036AE69B7
MILELATFLQLAQACAPTVSPTTLAAVVQTESKFNTLAININGEGARYPRSPEEAVEIASSAIADGKSVDLGIGQINSRNLDWLDLTVADAFDPCKNLSAAAKVLEDGYTQSVDESGQPGQEALQMAFSAYNTGNTTKGFRNGYVARVLSAATEVVPAIELERATQADGSVTLHGVQLPPGAPRVASEVVATDPTSREGDAVKTEEKSSWDPFNRERQSAGVVLFRDKN